MEWEREREELECKTNCVIKKKMQALQGQKEDIVDMTGARKEMTTDMAWTKKGGYKETWQQPWHGLEQRTGVIQRHVNNHGMGLNKELGL